LVSEERNIWAGLIVLPISMAIYVLAILQQGAGRPLSELQWAPIMAWTIGASIIAMVLISVLWGSIVSIKNPRGVARSDQRDRDISRRSDRMGEIPIVSGAIAVIVLSAAEVDWFWIANSMFVAFGLSMVVGGIASVHAYHRGLA